MASHKDKQLKFEDYLSFFGNGHADNLTTNQLNQVLFLHGFQKLNYSREIGLNKEEIRVAVSSLNLTPPARFGSSDSNIQLSVSTSKPALSLKEVKQDIQQIGWEECPLGSMVAINPAALAIVDNPIPPLTSQKGSRGKANGRNRNEERRDMQYSVSEQGIGKDLKEL